MITITITIIIIIIIIIIILLLFNSFKKKITIKNEVEINFNQSTTGGCRRVYWKRGICISLN